MFGLNRKLKPFSKKDEAEFHESSKYIIDSYAWIQYFRASKLGEIAKKYIESEDSITPTIVVSEISRKLTKEIELGNETPKGRTERLKIHKSQKPNS